ncbi:glycosyltransferase [Brachybacterium endophyticum]|uniref:glycosyltransferase n=1 Tax=Brachybacterium endophyticum TaxID=2182385 RepID=UPI0010583303|nr:glycosyltransferase [Brachybacterium endophyticum]
MHVGTTLQQTTGEDTPLWEQTFAAWAWRPAVGARPVQVTARAADPSTPARLLGGRDGVIEDLGELGANPRTLDLTDPTTPPWLWVAGASSVRWSVEVSDREPAGSAGGARRALTLPQVTAVVPTFRREQDATAQAAAFAAMEHVARVLVIDQAGTLASHAPFTELREQQPSIELIEQPNLGGSGGYARGMLASLSDPSQAVFLSDDDAVISAESMRRILTFQTLAEAPTIVGTGLLAADAPGTLLAHAEHVDRTPFFWRPADGMEGPLDLRGTTPADWDALLPRTAPDYTGWWGTLLPPGAVGLLGLPAPYFLKWDDAEYGLRATRNGYSTAVLPGASVTHPSWDAYRTQMSWSARILHRNRLATAAACGAGPGVLVHSLLHQAKHVLSGLHLTALLWDDGARAALSGPESWLGKDLGRARQDGQRIVDDWRERQQARTADLSPTRTAPFSLPAGALRAQRRLLAPSRTPQEVLALPAEEISWRTTLGADGVIITSPDGARIDAFTIDGHDDRALLLRVLRTHAGLGARWGRLRRRYARALPAWTTDVAWRRILADATGNGSGNETRDDSNGKGGR